MSRYTDAGTGGEAGFCVQSIQRRPHRYPEAPEHTRMSMCVQGTIGAKCPMPGHLCTQSDCDPLHLLTNEVDRVRD